MTNPEKKRGKSSKIVRVSLIQPELTEDDNKTYKNIENLIRSAVKNDSPDIIILPERWIFINPFGNDIKEKIQNERGEQYTFIKRLAAELHIHIVAGAIWEYREGYDKPFITSYFFNEKGEEIGRQDKINLYSVEQAFFNRGNEIYIFPYKNLRTGLEFKFSILICFDLHASGEFAKMAVKNGAEIIFSPTLIRESGEENWSIYVKARALETRTPIISVNSIHSYADRRFRGNSKIITFKRGSTSPVKLVVSEAGSENTYFTRDIDLSYSHFLRKKRLEELMDLSLIKIVKIE